MRPEEPQERGCTHYDFCGCHGGSDAHLLLERDSKSQNEDLYVNSRKHVTDGHYTFDLFVLVGGGAGGGEGGAGEHPRQESESV